MLPPSPTHAEVKTSLLKGFKLFKSKSEGRRIDSPDNTYQDYIGICSEEEYKSIKDSLDYIPLKSRIDLPDGKVIFILENVRLIFDDGSPEMIDIETLNELSGVSSYVYAEYKDNIPFSMYRCRGIHNVHDIEICHLTLKETAYHGLITEDKISMYIENSSRWSLLNDPGKSSAFYISSIKLNKKVLIGEEADRLWNETLKEIQQKFIFDGTEPAEQE